MISAKIVQDSVTTQGKRITTFELEYPRFIHSEFMTHRQFSRNCASSRAIPIDTMHKQVLENPAEPVHWGKNQPGMQAKQELEGDQLKSAKVNWLAARDGAVHNSKMLAAYGVHKQIANRVTEPFQTMKTVVTSTEWANWFWLRFHADAQPEIQELARQMLELHCESVPLVTLNGEWHVPYVTRSRHPLTGTMRYITNGHELEVYEAITISTSCCAQVSYRKLDDTLEKAQQIFDRLVKSEPVHASPTEHQATPIESPKLRVSPDHWEPGVTHVTRNGDACSGNFVGWVQHRQLIPGHCR